jgi:predicted ATP-grasp superfamily ATP-dependent carboligase
MDGSAPERTILIHEYISGGGLKEHVELASLAPEGLAMRSAVAADFASLPRVRVLATLDSRLGEEHRPWTTIPVAHGRELETFTRVAAEADCTVLIAPETEGILLDRARRLETVGGRSLGSTPGAIALCGDKALLGPFLDERGITTPQTRVVRPAFGLPREFPYPAVLKPIDGAGAIDTFVLGRADDCPPEAAAMKRALLQPYVSGVAMSASFLVGRNGSETLVGVALQHVDTDLGRIHYQGGAVPVSPIPPLEDVKAAVTAVRGLHGWVGVDYLWNEAEARLVVLEINPRLTTSYVGFRRLLPRGELARAWLLAHDEPGALPRLRLSERVARQPQLDFSSDGTIKDEVFIS